MPSQPSIEVDVVSEEPVKDSGATEPVGIKAKDDPRYQKFFKMLRVGVLEPAVRLKMQNEGLDPNILE